LHFFKFHFFSKSSSEIHHYFVIVLTCIVANPLLPICLKSDGKNTTFGFPAFDTLDNESRYLIYIAAGVFKISEAVLINFAD